MGAWTAVIGLLAGICLVMSLASFVPLAHGAVRLFDFPRLQVLAVAAATLLLSAATQAGGPIVLLAQCAFAVSLVIQLTYVARFSPLWKRRTKTFRGPLPSGNSVRVLICNVKQSNTRYARMQDMVRGSDPDIAVFMEVDDAWLQHLTAVLGATHESVSQPQSNTYGLVLYSRFPIVESSVRFLLNDEVPSIDCVLKHPNGHSFRLFALHPEPPVVSRDTIGRDAEIALVGKLARAERGPVIVTGDLNDVAWSATTRRFLRLSRLLDPREGRGLYNTFDARIFFLRWPLDHIFHSPRFQLIDMKRLPHVGSDHFPMLYDLALTNDNEAKRELDAAQPTDFQEANELISVEKNRDRRPAGHDWEDKGR